MDPFVGEVRAFSFGRIPNGWLPCNGQTLAIQQYTPLFALLGTHFGGNGTTNFMLPNLNGVVPMHYNPTQNAPNSGTAVGAKGGAEAVTLNLAQIPLHNHTVAVNTAAADQPLPINNFPATLASPHLAFAPATSPAVNMAMDFVSCSGSGAPHPNLQPYLTVNFCICVMGIWPPQP